MLNGRIGQVIGPFVKNVDLLEDNQPIGAFTPETTKPVLYKLGIQAEQGTLIRVNNAQVKIGKTGIYELDNVVNITELVFLTDTDSDTIIDFVY